MTSMGWSGVESVKSNVHDGWVKSEGPAGDFSDLDAMLTAVGDAPDAELASGRGKEQSNPYRSPVKYWLSQSSPRTRYVSWR
jgi:hypothetical protein